MQLPAIFLKGRINNEVCLLSDTDAVYIFSAYISSQFTLNVKTTLNILSKN